MANTKIRVKYRCTRCGHEIEKDYGIKAILGGNDFITPCLACADKDEFKVMRGEMTDIEKSNICKTCKQEYQISFGDMGKNRLFCLDCIKKEAEETKKTPTVVKPVKVASVGDVNPQAL